MPSTHELAKSLMEIIEHLEPLRETTYPPTTPAGLAYFKLCAIYRLILVGNVADGD